MNGFDEIKKRCVTSNLAYLKFFGEWIIVFEKLHDAKTNENRQSCVDKNYALFRADKLKVLQLININNPDKIGHSVGYSFYDSETKWIDIKFKVGEITNSNGYDENDNVHSKGIYYYNTIEAAYFSNKVPQNYNGYGYLWDDDGKKIYEGLYLNGSNNKKSKKRKCVN